MNAIFKKNLLMSLAYTFIVVSVSFLFSRVTQSIILGIIFALFAGIHFMVVDILMAINHFQSNITQRNGYAASFTLVFLLLFLVQTLNVYLQL
jgi:multidrug transporter EmrE-like cation transporter